MTVFNGTAGWRCFTPASLLTRAMTPGPGKLGTLHGTFYVCPAHRAAAEERITGAGFKTEVDDAPPNHQYDPWPCGFVTVHQSMVTFAALTEDNRTELVQQVIDSYLDDVGDWADVDSADLAENIVRGLDR